MAQEHTVSNNKRIAKNTMFLYVRMLLILVVSLFTSRVVLHVLGVSDYGIYNIIGGIVVLFSFVNGALTSATQRFLNFYLGKQDEEKTHKVFCISMSIYAMLSVVFLVLAETVGLWFVNTQLNIPPARADAAFWIYQFTVFTFMLNLTRIPYNATLIAYERMDFYAYLSLLDVVLKLGIVYLLYISPVDKLIAYGFLLLLVNVADNVAYRVYCVRSFRTARYRLLWDRGMFKDLFSFSGWSLMGNAANILAQQGLNIVVNIFYGVTLNAALGIANQISGQVVQFFTNFQTAFNPQIVKYYAAGQIREFFNLVYKTSKYSYFLMLFISLPLLLETDKMLDIWLVDVPEYTGIFCQLILIFYLSEALTAPLYMSVQAAGHIRNYQILVSSINFLTVPAVYVVLKLGMAVWSVWVVRILINVVIIVARVIYLRSKIGLSVRDYLNSSIFPILYTSVLVLPVPLACLYAVPGYWLNLLVTVAASLVSSVIFIYMVGMSKSERGKVKGLVMAKLLKKHVCTQQ